MPRTKPREEASPNPQLLIDAAIGLICERGVAGSSVDAICKRAGTAKTAVYWHFGSKDALLMAVIQEVSRVCVTELRDAVYGAKDPLDRLTRLISGLKSLVDNRSRHMQVKQAIISEKANVSPKVFEVARRLSRITRETIAQGFADAMGRRVADPDLLAHTIISLTHGALRMKILDPEWTDTKRLFDDLRNTVLLLLAARSGG
jgi:AcrR family transcriptional regulator